MIKAVIIDDEEHAIILLKKVLQLFTNNLEVIGESSNLIDGLKTINKTKPDVVFLDINMPEYSGLDINEFMNVADRNFEIIFVTAHQEYAIDAFKTSAFDYILKPIDEDNLKQCLNRLETHLNATKHEAVNTIESNQNHKLALNTQNGTYYLDFDKIYYVEAAGMYSYIHTDSEKITISKPLVDIEKMLNNAFFRVHRSFLVNTNKIKMLTTKDGGDIELINGKLVVLARNRIEEFKKFMIAHYGLDS